MADATWREATDNVRAGGVVFEDNHPFIIVPIENVASGYKYPIAPDSRSTLTVRVAGQETDVVEQNDDIIKFKNGNYFGIEYVGYRQLNRFVYIEGQEVLGTTTVSNLPYTQYWLEDYPRYFFVTIGGQDYPVYAREISETFVYPTDPQYYYIQFADYVSFATNETIGYMWRPDFPTTLGQGQYGFVGELGYPDAQPIVNFLAGNSSSKPDYPGDPSQTGGGSGYFYSQNDVIDIPALPSIQAIDFGFATIYNPSIANIQAVASWLWSDDFDEAIKLNYISPFDNIVGLSIVPVNVSSVSGILRVGNVDSNIAVPRVTAQYGEIDCGSLNVKEFWGSFLDYNASYSIYLPFIGYRALKPDDMVNGELGVVYHYDLLTGIVVAFIWARKEDGIKHVLYTYTGNMFYNVAFSGANFMSLYNQQLSATTSGINNAMSSVGQIASGNILGGLTSLITGTQQAQRQYDTAKPDYGRGGNNGGNAGLFGIRYPYLVQSLPIGQTPKNYKNLQGIPSQIYKKLSDLSGYTEIDAVIVNTLTCTEEEQEQIIQQLKEGVIL